MGVEGYAVYHYNTVEGWPCALHAEGSSFTAMFVLLIWEQVFSPGVPNVFRTPYQVVLLLPFKDRLHIVLCNLTNSLQAGPLDLFSEHFYTNRKDIVEGKLSWIRTAAAEVRITS